MMSSTMEHTGPVTMLASLCQSWLPGAWGEYCKNMSDLAKTSAKFN